MQLTATCNKCGVTVPYGLLVSLCPVHEIGFDRLMSKVGDRQSIDIRRVLREGVPRCDVSSYLPEVE